MSYLLEILGRGLLAELSAAFTDLLRDDGHFSTAELRAAYESESDCAEPALRYGTRCLANRDYVAARVAFETALAVEPDVILYIYDGKYSDPRVRAQLIRVTPEPVKPVPVQQS